MTSSDSNSAIRKVAIASSIGTTIGWYDFFVYNLAAMLVFDKVFFGGDPQAILKSLGGYAAGFVARPIGGLVCGHFGDRISRKFMLVGTLIVTGVSTLLIGLLPALNNPAFNNIGAWSPLLLVTLRFAQGLSIGGEWAGAVLMPVEYAPGYQRGYYASWTQLGVPAGLFLSNVIFFGLVTMLPEMWGWRVPFLLSIMLVVVGLYIRRTIADSPEFRRIKSTCCKVPLLDAWRQHRKDILIAMGAKAAENGVFYLYTTFILIYSTKKFSFLKPYPLKAILVAISLCALLMIPAIPLYGRLSDRIGRKPVYLFGAIFTGLFAFPFFWLINSGRAGLMTLAVVCGLTLGWAAMYAPQASFFSELFNTRVRYTGASFGAQVTTIFVGGLAPIIAVALLTRATSTWPIALYLIGLSAVTTVSVFLAPETAHKDISAESEVSPEKENAKTKIAA